MTIAFDVILDLARAPRSPTRDIKLYPETSTGFNGRVLANVTRLEETGPRCKIYESNV